jgi:hypothetical protein
VEIKLQTNLQLGTMTWNLARLSDHTVAIFSAKKSKHSLDANKIPADKKQTTLKEKKQREK